MSQLRGSQHYIWSLADVLGQGATGAVYKARHKVGINAMLQHIACHMFKKLEMSFFLNIMELIITISKTIIAYLNRMAHGWLTSFLR